MCVSLRFFVRGLLNLYQDDESFANAFKILYLFFFKLAKINSIKSHIDAVYTLTKT